MLPADTPPGYRPVVAVAMESRSGRGGRRLQPDPTRSKWDRAHWPSCRCSRDRSIGSLSCPSLWDLTWGTVRYAARTRTAPPTERCEHARRPSAAPSSLSYWSAFAARRLRRSAALLGWWPILIDCAALILSGDVPVGVWRASVEGRCSAACRCRTCKHAHQGRAYQHVPSRASIIAGLTASGPRAASSGSRARTSAPRSCDSHAATRACSILSPGSLSTSDASRRSTHRALGLTRLRAHAQSLSVHFRPVLDPHSESTPTVLTLPRVYQFLGRE